MKTVTFTEDIVIPVVHLNGDRKHVLAAQLEDAYAALRKAQHALQACTPNQRNFYVSREAEHFERAMAQHKARVEALQLVKESLVAEAQAMGQAYPTAR